MSDVDTKAKRRNKRWPDALKREIVAATFKPKFPGLKLVPLWDCAGVATGSSILGGLRHAHL